MAKFRSKEKIVEAEQFFSDKSPLPLRDFGPIVLLDHEGWHVVTIHGQRTPIVNGDWIILERYGDFAAYPCKSDIFEASYELAETEPKPIDMLIFCPNCYMQHIDRPAEEACECGHLKKHHYAAHFANTEKICMHCECSEFRLSADHWVNPPHKSHLCLVGDGGCGSIFRIADIPTNGVAQLRTMSTKDTWHPEGFDESQYTTGGAL